MENRINFRKGNMDALQPNLKTTWNEMDIKKIKKVVQYFEDAFILL